MSQTGVTAFDSTVQVTNVWLKDLGEALGWSDRHKAYRALRVVLHALRDHLTIDEVVTLGAQFPLLVRGAYYEGWHPADKPLKDRHKAGFLALVAKEFRNDPDADPELVCRAVFAVLERHVTAGEVEGVKKALPHEIRDLWR
jgi:uncharacterized protein (DUF2267 family)